MRRRDFISILTAVVTALPVAALAQTNRVPRIGILSPNPPASIYSKAFLQGLRDLGYVEGQNVIVEYRDSAGRSDALSALAAELVQAGVDVIFTNGSEATRAARQMTTSIPIVMTSTNPLDLGFVASLAGPASSLKETVTAAKAIGLKPQTLTVTDGNSIDAAFEDAVKQGAQAVIPLPGPQMGLHLRRIAPR
jgi:ABC-type uncharacterized transport system substrate-binding protein